ncbi:unnamed protein product [Allacma fusca]|uniref:Uncharacterized protein n=1 Tax=Allacma fusca TaxID=39272 RepID=A0A8J2L5R2_9HEXA|nr:unnamed protein product [Allacma fusca]
MSEDSEEEMGITVLGDEEIRVVQFLFPSHFLDTGSDGASSTEENDYWAGDEGKVPPTGEDPVTPELVGNASLPRYPPISS